MNGPTIARVDASVYVVPTDRPEADGTLAWDETTVVVVHVHAGDTSGVGWTYGPTACASVVSDTLAGVVVGRAAFDVTGAWQSMVRACRNMGRPGVVSMAIAAVDIALWDLKAKLLDLPLNVLLGLVEGAVRVYGSGGFTTYDDATTIAQVDGWLAQGITAVKIKIGEDCGAATQRDLRRTELVRRHVGDDIAVFVDANGAYTTGQAVRIGRALDDLDVGWFEEPVSSDDLDGLSVVRRAVIADVAAGEYGYDLAYFARMCDAGSIDCLQVDVTRCAGITEWRRVAAVAAAHGLEVSSHCAPALHAHPATTIANFRHAEYFHDHVRIEAMLFDGAPVMTDGLLAPNPDAPGLGMTLREDRAARWRRRCGEQHGVGAVNPDYRGM